jgi:hypothetical protein
MKFEWDENKIKSIGRSMGLILTMPKNYLRMNFGLMKIRDKIMAKKE